MNEIDVVSKKVIALAVVFTLIVSGLIIISSVYFFTDTGSNTKVDIKKLESLKEAESSKEIATSAIATRTNVNDDLPVDGSQADIDRRNTYQSQCIKVNYLDMINNHETLLSKKVTLTGKVTLVSKQGDVLGIRALANDNPEHVIEADQRFTGAPLMDGNINVDDNITIWGTFTGHKHIGMPDRPNDQDKDKNRVFIRAEYITVNN